MSYYCLVIIFAAALFDTDANRTDRCQCNRRIDNTIDYCTGSGVRLSGGSLGNSDGDIRLIILADNTLVLFEFMCRQSALFLAANALVPVALGIVQPSLTELVPKGGTFLRKSTDGAVLIDGAVGVYPVVRGLCAFYHRITALNAAKLPVLIFIVQPFPICYMLAGGNDAAVGDDLTAAKALDIAGIAIGSRRMVRQRGIDNSSAAIMVISILATKEYGIFFRLF